MNMHRDIKDRLQWRTGVVLEDTGFGSTAVVKVDHEAKRVYIYVDGGQKRDYFAAILLILRRINHSFEKLKTKELIPMPDDDEVTASYRHLIRLEKKGVEDYYPGESEEEYKVKDLLGTVKKDGPTIEDIFELLKRMVDANDTEDSIARKVNSVISWEPSFLGLKINGTQAADILIDKALQLFGKKKKQ
ncbi:MAG: hypothetical protein GY940_28410 [bacterium]|nr:hypothetical protein [bacterium]